MSDGFDYKGFSLEVLMTKTSTHSVQGYNKNLDEDNLLKLVIMVANYPTNLFDNVLI